METKETSSRQGDWVSIALPIVLIFTGLLLVGGDILGMLSLDRIQNFWPVALIAIGLAELLPAGGSAQV